MSDKEKAGEKWVNRYGIPKWLETDTDEDRKRYSCDGCDQSISSIREAYLAGAEWATPKWIKCSERLPELNQLVLTWSYDKKMDWGHMTHQHWWEVCRDGMEHVEVTHWMEIPEAPKEEE